MKKLTILCCTIFLAASLAGCANMTPRERNTLVGSGIGAAAGGLVTGSGWGALGGAAVGGLVGYNVR